MDELNRQSADEQANQLMDAVDVAGLEGLIPLEKVGPLMEAGQWTPEMEVSALNLLITERVRPKLKAMDLIFPTRGTFVDRLSAEPRGDGWLVRNESKGTKYVVTRHGFGWACTCDSGRGYCKHRDFVEDIIRNAEGEPNPPESDVESETEPEIESDSMLPLESCAPVELRPGMLSTPEQSGALWRLRDWWENGCQAFRLTGYAGTGKTTIILRFLADLRQANPDLRVALAAPTNKATKVLQSVLTDYQDSGIGLGSIEVLTVAKLLAIRERKVEGQQTFERDFELDPPIQQLDLVVIDESSMIGTQLYGFCLDELMASTLFHSPRIVFMGDLAQLPPVNEGTSLALSDPAWPGVELRQVQRFGGAIGDLANALRQDLGAKTFPVIETNHNDDKTKGVWALAENEWEALMLKAFASDHFKSDPNYYRAIAWRNKTVDRLNRLIRKQLGLTGQVAVGERLVFDKPWRDFEGGVMRTLFNSSDEVDVLSVTPGSVGPYHALSLQVTDGQAVRQIWVLSDKSKAQFTLDQAKARASKQWGKFWGYLESLAWTKPAYALTVHKSQGSTFGHGFVHVADIQANRRQYLNPRKQTIYERNQLLYVAITRFRDRVFVTQ